MNKFLALSMAMAVMSASNGCHYGYPRRKEPMSDPEELQEALPIHTYSHVPKPVKEWHGKNKLSRKQRKNKKQ